jgi:DNA-binding response OmpR family regulator
MDMGADDYITKPFRMADLLRTVVVHLRGSVAGNYEAGACP